MWKQAAYGIIAHATATVLRPEIKGTRDMCTTSFEHYKTAFDPNSAFIVRFVILTTNNCFHKRQ